MLLPSIIQEVATTPVGGAVAGLFSTIVAALTVPLMDLLKRLAGFLGGLQIPTFAKPILAGLVALGLTYLGTWSGVQLPNELELVQNADLQALLSFVLATSYHGVRRKTKESAPKTI